METTIKVLRFRAAIGGPFCADYDVMVVRKRGTPVNIPVWWSQGFGVKGVGMWV